MALPTSFARDGFQPLSKLKGLHRLMIGTDGFSNTGKTEFALSAPGPGMAIFLDRGCDSVIDNPHPPESRQSNWAFKVISVPLATQATQASYLEYWRSFYKEFKAACDNPDCRTILLDGDSDSWELQRLAEFGKLTQIPPIMYTNVNAARRAMIARAWDTGKIIIATNKIKDEYKTVVDAEGNPVLKDGKESREKSGEYVRQGFADQDYLWQIQIRHLYQAPRINAVTKKQMPQQWGLRIMKCKVDTSLQGVELWGKDACFAGLVQTIYPHIPLKDWGF
jgi:hypothetical protein